MRFTSDEAPMMQRRHTQRTSDLADGISTVHARHRWTDRMIHRAVLPSFAMLLNVFALSAQQTNAPATHTRKPKPKEVVWGYYDAKTPPVLRIKSGDTVEIQTLIASNPERFEAAGVGTDQIEPAFRDIVREVKEKGPGPPSLTGPVFIEGAEPGDTLEVRIQQIGLAIPYAINAFLPGRGFLPDDFPYARTKVIPLDEKRMVAHFADGVEIPIRPFFGSMGVAPPEVTGPISSGPPWVHAGNLDDQALAPSTTLFIPVHARRALFEVGDGHAGQGNGEVDLSAMAT